MVLMLKVFGIGAILTIAGISGKRKRAGTSEMKQVPLVGGRVMCH
jgi:hypothetical protein